MKRVVVLVLIMALLVSGCGGNAPSPEISSTSVDGIQKPANSGESMKLNVLNWGDYIDESALAMFREEYPNIDVNYETFTSNEEMLVMVSQENSIYDVCIPSDYTISKMINMDLLAPLDKSMLPHLVNIDENFLKMGYDPDSVYSVPYLWGTVGILYDTTKVTYPVDSWDVLWDEQYSKQIFMYDSVRDTLGIALKRLGYSMNSVNPAELAEAEASLIEQKPLVQAYGLDDLRDKLIGGSGTFAVVYSGDAIFSIDENPDLAYCVPVEGSNMWFDGAVILKNSKNKEAAHLFIDFLCRSDIARLNTEYIGYSSPNKAAMDSMDAETLADEVYNPPQDVLDRCEVFVDIGDEGIQLYDEAWTRVKAS